MNIYEALKKRTPKQGIRRSSWLDPNRYMVPTDTSNCCLIYKDTQLKVKRWAPQAKDLQADDWEIITKTGSVHLRISLDGQTISDSHFEREQLTQLFH